MIHLLVVILRRQVQLRCLQNREQPKHNTHLIYKNYKTMSIDDRLTYMGLKAFNFLYDTVVFLKYATKQGLADFSAYMGGRYAFWHFLDNAVGPLPDSIVKTRNNIVWSYNTDRNILHHHQSEDNIYRGVSWLAAMITCNGIDYDISNFSRSFFYSAPEQFMPNMRLFMMCWSLNSGIWFTPNDNPQLQIVDENGEEQSIYLFDRSNTAAEHWSALLGSSSDTDTDNSTDVSDDLPASEGVSVETAEGDTNVVNDNQADAAADTLRDNQVNSVIDTAQQQQQQEDTTPSLQTQLEQPVIVEHRELTSEDMEMVD